MALPNYVRQATGINQNQWQQLRPARQERLTNRYAPQPAPDPAPDQGFSSPYTPPASTPQPTTTTQPATPPSVGPTSGFPDPIVSTQTGYTGTVGASTDVVNHPFYDPNNNYRLGGVRGTTQTPWNDQTKGSLSYMNYATQNPEAYYYGLMNQMGYGGVDAKSQAAQGMYRDYARGYEAAKAMGTQDLWFPEFMGGQDVRGTINMMSNEQLGIDESRYNSRTRWGMRGY